MVKIYGDQVPAAPAPFGGTCMGRGGTVDVIDGQRRPDG